MRVERKFPRDRLGENVVIFSLSIKAVFCVLLKIVHIFSEMLTFFKEIMNQLIFIEIMNAELFFMNPPYLFANSAVDFLHPVIYFNFSVKFKVL